MSLITLEERSYLKGKKNTVPQLDPRNLIHYRIMQGRQLTLYMCRGFDIPWVGGSNYHGLGLGGQITMDRGGQNRMGRGSKYPLGLKKKFCVSGNPTDPIFTAPTLIFFGQKKPKTKKQQQN